MVSPNRSHVCGCGGRPSSWTEDIDWVWLMFEVIVVTSKGSIRSGSDRDGELTS